MLSSYTDSVKVVFRIRFGKFSAISMGFAKYESEYRRRKRQGSPAVAGLPKVPRSSSDHIDPEAPTPDLFLHTIGVVVRLQAMTLAIKSGVTICLLDVDACSGTVVVC